MVVRDGLATIRIEFFHTYIQHYGNLNDYISNKEN
jgi:hypothetical protein